jgi:flagellar hook-basal body complex protein FliE
MSDMRVAGVGGAPGITAPVPAGRAVGASGFGETLRNALGQVNQLQGAADQAVQDFSVGRTKDVAGTLIAVEKANLGFQLALQIRNRLLEAYQEVLRMPL